MLKRRGRVKIAEKEFRINLLADPDEIHADKCLWSASPAAKGRSSPYGCRWETWQGWQHGISLITAPSSALG